MEGRRVFRDLTVEENLMAGAYTRKDRRNLKVDMEKIYVYFPKLKALQGRKAGFLVRWRATNACNWQWDHGKTKAIVTR